MAKSVLHSYLIDLLKKTNSPWSDCALLGRRSVPRGGGGGGGGGYSSFFRIRRLGRSIYRSPQKNIRNFKHSKKYLKFMQPKKISQFCTLTLKKILKCIEMTLKLAQFCDDPTKISTKSSYPPPPQNIHFSENSKNIEIQNFEPPPPKKNSPSLRMCENIRVPPPPGICDLNVLILFMSDQFWSGTTQQLRP